MTLIEMEAWSPLTNVVLTHEQAAEIAQLGLVEVVAQSHDGSWILSGTSRIGVAAGHGWELRVTPRLSVPRLFFLLAYATDPKGWLGRRAEFTEAPDLLGAIASGFSWHALHAVERGLLRGYLTVDERLLTVRGRILFADQIAKDGGLPLPIEVSYDEYTDDILENRLLKSATIALLGLRSIPPIARKRLLKLRGLLGGVALVQDPRAVKMPPITRLNERYRLSLRLAELILHASSIDAPKGTVTSSAFVFDMNRVFEDFVTISLTELLTQLGGRVSAQWTGSLDTQKKLSIRPDVTWWGSSGSLAVVDAKYKALATKTLPNPDAYQMLAYCTALRLDRGFLVYASDSGEQPRRHDILNNGPVIEVRTLDVEREPDVLLQQVALLAAEIARSAADVVPA